MKKFYSLQKILLSPRTVAIVWFLVAFVCALLKDLLGEGAYNNFMIFRGVAHHLFEELPLYIHYPAEYSDLNHYGPFFAFVIAPFAYFPSWLAMPLWVVGSSMLVYWAVRKLPLTTQATLLVLWISINDLFTAGAMQQFNLLTAAMLIGSFVLIERRCEGWAALLIVVGTFVKIYGIIGLAFFFFVKRKGRFIFYMVVWSLVALFVPLLFVSPDYLWGEYASWFADIADKNLLNIRVDQVYQNVSILGVIRKVTGSASYSDLPIMAGAILAFMLTYLRWKQFRSVTYRLVMLSSLMIFTVIFSTGSENSGYIIAALGVGLWWVTLPRRGVCAWVLLVLVCMASFANNLTTNEFYYDYIFRYALRSIPYTLVWAHTIWQLWFRDFVGEIIPQEAVDRTGEDIDVVLPCYNPRGQWADIVIKKFGALERSKPSHSFRLILVNDGSTNDNFLAPAQYIKSQIPSTLVVDNTINRGKGAAVRSGVALSCAPLVIYTDYDFPYRRESVVEIVSHLEAGADVVIAARNNTYHTKLSVVRRVISKLSRNLNWLLLGMDYPDAQGGLKGFNAKGREIFMQTRVNRFLFDTEFVYKSSKRSDVHIAQISANLRDGISLPSMKGKTIRIEAMNLIRIIFTA
ncbi:MAG: glycosyltransferase 87 family protein [Rikenellaceae bacterium]